MQQPQRMIQDTKIFSLKKFFFQWEWFLIFIFLGIQVMNSFLSEHYLSAAGLFGATSSFLDKAILALPMVFILLLGDIDISVGSTIALSSVVMAVSYNDLGLPMGLAMVICLLVGLLCGFVNGLILTVFTELAPMIVTLGTMILYRGIALIILKDQASGKFPEWFVAIGWGTVGFVPYMFIVFAVLALIFGFVMHKTVFGRKLYAIGSNSVASRYAGLKVQKIRLIVFSLTGLIAGLTAIFLTARMGSSRPNVAEGYELEAISMVVLGGISTAGGKGRFPGVVLSVFIIGFLRYGLGLINVPSQAMLLIIGALLIIVVMIPNLRFPTLSFLKKQEK